MIRYARFDDGIVTVAVQGHITTAASEAVSMAGKLFDGTQQWRLVGAEHNPADWEALASDGVTIFYFATKEAFEKDAAKSREFVERLVERMRANLGLGDN